MPKANPIQSNFSAGEVSPLLRGRVDTQKYANGAETVSNFITYSQGPLGRRPGSKYVGEVKTSSKKTRLLPFQFSSTDRYVLEFGDFYARIWRDSELVVVTAVNTYNITGITLGGTCRVQTAGHAYNGASVSVYMQNIVGTYELNGLVTSAFGTSATEFRVNLSATNAWVSGGTISVLSGGTTFELATPYGENDLDAIQITQSADVVFIVHPNFQPRIITRSGALTWSIGTYDAIDGPYMSIDPRDISMTLSAVSDAATMVGSTAPFVAGDVNKYVEFQDKGVWQLAKISAYTSASQVTVDIVGNTLTDLDPTTKLTVKQSATARSIPDATSYGRSPTIPNRNSSMFRGTPTGTPYAFGRFSPAIREGVDPGANITDPGGGAGTNIDSSFSNTFSRYDVGKFFRTGLRVWRPIAAFTSSVRVVCGAAVTYMTATPAASTLSITAGSRTITATLTASGAAFASTDVGRHIRLNYNSIWVWGKITAYTSTTVVMVTLYDEPPADPIDNTAIISNGRTLIWRFGSWSITTGWPRAISFHEQRLVFGGSTSEPQTIWLTRSGDFYTFSPTEQDSSVLDDNGIGYTLASNEVNAIIWLQSHSMLLIGTIGGEWQARAASSIQEPITPTNISIVPQSRYGSIDYNRAIRINSSVLFVQRSGRKLIELSYSFELDAWQGRDLNVASEHILRGASDTSKAKQTAWCGEPHNLFWILLEDGTLVCVSYLKEQEMLAWHKHSIGGTGTVESICSIPSPDNTSNQLWMVVNRTINGSTKRYIERIEFNELRYLDCYTEPTSTNATIAGASYLEAATVEVVSTQALPYTSIGTFVVSAGNIASGVVALKYYGLPYTSTLKFLPPEGGSPFGTSQGKQKRIARTCVRVYKSTSFKHGATASPTVEVQFANIEVNAANPFTGDFVFNSEASYSVDQPYWVTQTKGLPLNILAWMPQVYTYE